MNKEIVTAVSIIIKGYTSGTLPASVAERVQVWFAENKLLHEKYLALEEVFESDVEYSESPSEDAEKMYIQACQKLGIPIEDKKKQTIKNRAKLNLLSRKWLVGGVAAVFLLTAGFLIFNSITKTDTTILIASVSTTEEEVKEISLPDGTTVLISPSSTVSYDFKDGRNVFLTGEAFFDVVENEELAFIVSTENLSVSVRGTKFRVSESNDVRAIVALHEGEVAVVAGEQELELQQGEYLCYYPHDKEVVVSKFTEGQDNNYLFDFYMTSLDNILRTLSTYYSVEVDSKGVVYNKKYTICFFPEQSVSEAFDMLQLLTNEFVYNIENDKIILTKK